MIYLNLKNLKNNDNWVIHQNDENFVAVRGYFYYCGDLYKREKLVNFILNSSFENLLSILENINGFYAIIKKVNNELIAIVDRVRSIPLFYSHYDRNSFYVSDDPYWIKDHIETEVDILSKEEFLAVGYVTGNNTLYKGIYQLQAGEYLYINHKDIDKPEIKRKRYYKMEKELILKNKFQDMSFELLLEELDQRVRRVFLRTIEVLNGRTAVIPLSGGHDSRLIALMLKIHGYDKVICYSYGREGNLEAKISESVAKSLGFRWEFVPYTINKWYRWYNSNEAEEYIKFSDGLSSVSHFQDWPAVWELKKRDILPPDSVFLPGHSGDFIAGSHISNVYEIYGNLSSIKDIVNAILTFHYNLYKYSKKNLAPFKKKIYSLLAEFNSHDSKKLEDAYEYWDWQERQSKFIVNSVRVYEFWGYDWLIPLWDKELIDFLINIPFIYRLKQFLYITYIDKLYERIIFLETLQGTENISENKNNSFVNNILLNINKFIKNLLRLTKVYPCFLILISLLKRLNYKKEYYNHFLAWYGIINYNEFKEKYLRKGYLNINSFLAENRIRRL